MYASGVFSKYTFNPTDIEDGEARLLPNLFSQGGGMKRFAAPEDGDLRAGIRYEPSCAIAKIPHPAPSGARRPPSGENCSLSDDVL